MLKAGSGSAVFASQSSLSKPMPPIASPCRNLVFWLSLYRCDWVYARPKTRESSSHVAIEITRPLLKTDCMLEVLLSLIDLAVIFMPHHSVNLQQLWLALK